jgi:hypothetical protein
MASVPNVSGLSNCNSLPLQVTASSGTGLGGFGTATTVTVTYQTQRLIPIPALLTGQFTLSRIVVARVKT